MCVNDSQSEYHKCVKSRNICESGKMFLVSTLALPTLKGEEGGYNCLSYFAKAIGKADVVHMKFICDV